MATLLEQAQLLQNEDFRQRVLAAVLKTASDIFWEAPEAEHHALRKQLADNALRSPYAIRDLVLPGTLTNATVAAMLNDTSDNDLIFVVTSIWNRYAGVPGA